MLAPHSCFIKRYEAEAAGLALTTALPPGNVEGGHVLPSGHPLLYTVPTNKVLGRLHLYSPPISVSKMARTAGGGIIYALVTFSQELSHHGNIDPRCFVPSLGALHAGEGMLMLCLTDSSHAKGLFSPKSKLVKSECF